MGKLIFKLWENRIVLVIAALIAGAILMPPILADDENTCYGSTAPDCDWERGWHQAALNAGRISQEQAHMKYPDMQVGTKNPVDRALYEDDDPSNDPNACNDDADPENCDWNAGWVERAVEEGVIVPTAEPTRTRLEQKKHDWTLPNDDRRALHYDDDWGNDLNLCDIATYETHPELFENLQGERHPEGCSRKHGYYDALDLIGLEHNSACESAAQPDFSNPEEIEMCLEHARTVLTPTPQS